MKKWAILVSVAALILIIGIGCSSKSKDKTGSSGGLTLASYATPGGDVRENDQLPLTVVLSANRTAALIYYTAGATAADPDLNSSIYNPATPIVIDASFADGTYVIKYFAWYQDPTTHNFEQESPFNEAIYKFRLDITKPNVIITPNGGTFADPADVTIEITATDNISTPANITVKYTTDGSDPKTSGTAQTGTGAGTTVSWAGGTMTVKAYAIDEAGNESSVKTATFTINEALAAQKVLELINADRASLALDPLSWNASWAAACTAHATGLENAGNDEHGVADLDDQNKQLLDFDGDPATGYHIAATAYGFGTQASGPTDFYNKLKSVTALWDALMLPGCTEFGCGFNDDTWEMMCTYIP